MSLTALDLPPEALKAYRPQEVIHRRKLAARAELALRRRRALYAARKAARLLREEFDADEIIVFGSLASPGRFTFWSDIDLAARGIPPDRFYEAVGAVTGLSTEFRIDLVDIDDCPRSMKEAIEQESREL